MSVKLSIKLSNRGIIFLQKFRTNRRKVDTDEQDLPYWKLIEVIEDFFKTNNEEYLKIVKQEYKPHA